MRLLRSEEATPTGGATIDAARLQDLARRWYRDRLDPGWRPRTPEQSQRILDAAGLTGAFWRLA